MNRRPGALPLRVSPVAPVAPHTSPSAATLLSPSVDPGAEAAVEAAAVSGRPVVGITIVAAWAAVGVLLAVMVARRGHDLAPLVALGILLGPLFGAYATTTLMRDERAAEPLTLSPGRDMGGDCDVLVAVLDDPSRAADAVPLVTSVLPRVRRIVLARPVSYETVSRADALSRSSEQDAAAALFRASVFLPDIDPEMVLIPGRAERALARYVNERPVRYVVTVGEPRGQAALWREGSLRNRTVLITTPITEPRLDDR